MLIRYLEPQPIYNIADDFLKGDIANILNQGIVDENPRPKYIGTFLSEIEPTIISLPDHPTIGP